jgi:uncharacterized membrane protein
MSDTSAPLVERFSDGLQGFLQKVLSTSRRSPRHLKSFLNGTWLGHPLHPLITDIPITTWVLTAVFDIIWLISRANWSAYGAFVTVIVGLLAAVAAAVTGLADWSDTYGAERRVGLNHAIFNTVALLFYLVSFVLRLLAGPGDSLVAVILGLVGLVSVSYAGYLGGDMVFTKGTGVNHTAWEAAGEEYEGVMPVADIQEGKL